MDGEHARSMVFTVPLRGAWKTSRHRRANKAMRIIREFTTRHMKVRSGEEIWIDPKVNEVVWARGIEKPPRRIRLRITDHGVKDIPIEVKLEEDDLESEFSEEVTMTEDESEDVEESLED
ncbi:MAG TPA: 50S ribosomal protein L31e [Candidatus Poseidoniales archaeon]|nr:50S ribosomal protein L31e [Candidatus Poseidoniales archaeon]